MRWTVMSIITAILLIVGGFIVTGGDNMNISAKVVFWLCAFAFVTVESIHLMGWLREHDL